MKRIVNLLIVLFSIININAQIPMGGLEDPVSWSFKKTDKGNGLYELKFSAKIEEPWHVYALKLEQAGPIPTSINFNDNEGVILEGEVVELIAPKVKYDEGFRFDVGAYYGKAEFTQLVRVVSEKDVQLTGYTEYQCCNDETCLPPFQKEFTYRLKGHIGQESETVATTPVKKELKEEIPVEPETKSDEEMEEEMAAPEGPVIEQMQATEPLPTKSENDSKADRSLLGFLLATLGFGFLAILTPCVYPMIPMTISFFMRGEQKKSMTILKGLVFGLSMILVYTSVGVLVALLGVDANFGNVISTHWIPNLIFFTLFVIFAASFLGMFEIVLPARLVNNMDKQGDRGGLVGPFFMGITTVLVSFSCTGPIVGSLLAEAAGGEAIKPILGMLFFSIAFALPFTILAIFPSMMKSLPKSGGWLNTVKVVLGFGMFAFGMKFLSSMDQSYHLGIFTREVYLAVWFVLAIILGFYLLGKIKFAHDSDLPFISVPRLALAIISFVFAIYLFTGILGNKLSAISSMIPPMSAQSFNITGGTGAVPESSDQSATWAGPGKYHDILELPNGLLGYFDFEEGMKVAREKNRPVFLDFTGHSCSNCKQMENTVWIDPEVTRILKEEYVIISLYTDDRTELPEEDWVTTEEGKVLKKLGQVNSYLEQMKFNTIATPWYVLLSPEGEQLNQPIGKEMDIMKFRAFLMEGLANFNK